MRPEDFELFASVVHQRSGLALTAGKAYLLESRLPPVARKWHFKTIDELAQAVRTRRDEGMMNEITEAMTTNESFFFRDQRPFEQFRQVLLPRFLNLRMSRKQLRIWSAGCSSGQEAYSAAMICMEQAEVLRNWKIDIIGTDLSSEMIDRAKAGLYSQFEVQRGLPVAMLVKYFQQKDDKWEINEPLRRMVQFHKGNLLHDFGSIGVFDIVMCRNVLIYFDVPTRARVLNALISVMAPDGVLFLGCTETTIGISEKFHPLENERGIYCLGPLSDAARAAG